MIATSRYGIIGESDAVRALHGLIDRAAPLELPVLIEGPTGAGKELVAQALHAESGRAGRCVAVNVCAIPESMFESTLFGHVRGAFTGANADSMGYLQEADRGSLFLDEIGGLALPLQAKLLRAIETGSFRPVGAHADRVSDFRIISATNEPLERLVAEGRFRPDLAFRLSGILIDVPPLRERLDDVPALVRHFVRTCSTHKAVRFTEGAVHALMEHDWPGNVRELRRVVERAVALSERPLIRRHDIDHALRGGLTSHSAAPPSGAFERRRMMSILEQCEWDTARVAERLGVHRATVYRRMHRLGIAPPAAAGAKVDGAEPTAAPHDRRNASE